MKVLPEQRSKSSKLKTDPVIDAGGAKSSSACTKERREDPAQRLSEVGSAFPPLEFVNKPNLTTKELAYYSNMAEQTWRVKACYDSAPDGLRPIRVCGKLAWPTAGVKRLLGVT